MRDTHWRSSLTGPGQPAPGPWGIDTWRPRPAPGRDQCSQVAEMSRRGSTSSAALRIPVPGHGEPSVPRTNPGSPVSRYPRPRETSGPGAVLTEMAMPSGPGEGRGRPTPTGRRTRPWSPW